MIKHFCDRCEKEAESPMMNSSYINIARSGGSSQDRLLCRACRLAFDAFMEGVIKLKEENKCKQS